MDSITHIVLGATIGEVIAGKQLGKKAMVIGAIAQSVPDFDFIMSIWLRPVDELLSHRGITHSILFALVIATTIGLLASKLKRPNNLSASKWMIFIALELFAHLILDGLNNYGVGWFEPFSQQRISFNVIYVADPFYSIPLAIGFIALVILSIKSPARRIWTALTLTLSSLYLLYALHNKFVTETETQAALQKQGIQASHVLTTPTPLNNWLWFIAAEVDSGYYVGHRSVFDNTDPIELTYFPRNISFLNELKDKEDLQKLLRFSQGFYTIEKKDDALLFNDLRFGQIAGWSDPNAMFVFHYDLFHPDANMFVVQQGRFSNWNDETITVLLQRIAGKKNKKGDGN